MRLEIINIGDELLIGQVINTNGSWMAEQLNRAGFAVSCINVTGDAENEILDSLESAAERSGIIIITGGLGPTKDDITKKTLCRYFNVSLVFNEQVYQDIEELFKRRGFQMTPLNRAQAEIPENAIPLRNKNGTAPGMWFEQDINGKKVIFISLPGVPFEMKSLIEDEVIPRLKQRFQTPFIIHKNILTQGGGESYLADLIEKWELALPENVRLAYLPSPGLVRLRLSATGSDEKILSDQIHEEVSKLKNIIGDYIYGEDEDTFEAVIGKLLTERKMTLSVAESCTGGYIGHMITSVPGSSLYFMGGTIAYSNEIKQKILCVNDRSLIQYGAVSEQVVREMAEGCRITFATDFAVATSGIAGPGGGTVEKPVGLTWIAVASPERTIAASFLFGENRERNIRKAGLQALNMLRKEILSTDQTRK